MVSLVRQFQLEDRTVDVNLSQIPEISASSRDLIARLGTALPETPEPIAPGRVRLLMDTALLLQEVQNHRTRDRVVAALLTAFMVALVAGIVLGGVFLSPYCACVLGFALSGVLFTTMVWAQLRQESPLDNEFKPLHFLFPPFALLTRESRLEGLIEAESEKPDMQKILARLNAEHQRLLPNAHRFYGQDHTDLVDKLSKKVSQMEERWRQLSAPYPFWKIGREYTVERAGRKEAAEQVGEWLAPLRQARAELNDMLRFYSTL